MGSEIEPMEQKLKIILFFLITGFFSSCTYRFYQTNCDYPLPGKMHKHCFLDSALIENSGLLCADTCIWTFNDSQGEAALYALSKKDGSVIRKTLIRNALNADWEDIAEDESFIFVADVGNNYASRDTLTIYRISRDNLFAGQEEVNYDEKITFSYAGEVLRNRTGLSSHDCEALISYGDSLYLFSKDWVAGSSSVYVLPKTPGHYVLSPLFTYDAGFQVTGADIFPQSRQVALVGYKKFVPVLLCYEFENSPALISCGGKARLYPMRSGRQVEGICFDSEGILWVSSENSLKKQTLFRVGIQDP